jgi:hypothetical protein
MRFVQAQPTSGHLVTVLVERGSSPRGLLLDVELIRRSHGRVGSSSCANECCGSLAGGSQTSDIGDYGEPGAVSRAEFIMLRSTCVFASAPVVALGRASIREINAAWRPVTVSTADTMRVASSRAASSTAGNSPHLLQFVFCYSNMGDTEE